MNRSVLTAGGGNNELSITRRVFARRGCDGYTIGVAMSDKKRNCGNCFFWTPYRNPDTGRVKTSEPGDCNYPVQWPTLPTSYNAGVRLQQAMHSFPRRFRIWPGSGENCECWQGKA